ncbi:MAG: hypothetical protein KAY21_02185 [Limnohabitans sp.]|nr:hypothetical protein [Limnohabitans sp.]
MTPHLKALMTLAMLCGLPGCGLVSTQAVYEEIRAQEKAKAVGSGAAPSNSLPRYDSYQKERSELSNDKR